MPGSGQLTLTGTLGDVIKESAQTALSWVRAHAVLLGLSSGGGASSGAKGAAASLLDKTDIHIHFPAGAIPKDGPSAGVTIVTALVSLLTDSKTRSYTAMTGEITLRGLVLPVGGIKGARLARGGKGGDDDQPAGPSPEKVLAAHRSGIKRVVLPYRNRKDLNEVPATVKAEIEFVTAKRISDVLRAAFDAPLFRSLEQPASSQL